MKFKWDKKYLQWGITAFLTAAAILIFYYFMFHGDNIHAGIMKVANILMPIIYGAILAYLLTPVINFWERHTFSLYRRKHGDPSRKLRSFFRFLYIMLALILVVVGLFGLLYMVVPQVVSSIATVIMGLPKTLYDVQDWALELLRNNPDLEQVISNVLENATQDLQNWLTNVLLPSVNSLLLQISLGVVDVVVVLKNLFIGFIVSIYILASKETFAAQGKKLLFSLLTPRKANLFLSNLRFTNKTFGGFISGKLIDSLIIGILCFIYTKIVGAPYGMLVSVIVGVTNIIPFFGPYIGAIPSALLILMADPMQCVYFIIFIIVLQQFDGNILGPKILGGSTGLSSFWVLVSILLGGGLFGIVGMFIGVPLFAVLYAGAKALVNRSLSAKNLPTDTEAYLKLQAVDADTKEFEYPQEPARHLRKNTQEKETDKK
ncbi:AI-2E family transporter [Lachnospiraceae bacterium ASD3451]|uniref:AI-2E family transporter n=1 Tax=Diplocloster agilis TaxID=2850323 RepID=UPI001D768724|nr:AI-2E family transporter [Diplocloster agilis]MBU9743649.1 AI-2E family transporter [Diplocloster agilis]